MNDYNINNAANYNTAQKTPVTSILGLIFGILSLLVCPCFSIFSLILSIPGLICSIVGKKQNNNGIGKAGFIISLICTILAIIYFFILLVYVKSPYFDLNSLNN